MDWGRGRGGWEAGGTATACGAGGGSGAEAESGLRNSDSECHGPKFAFTRKNEYLPKYSIRPKLRYRNLNLSKIKFIKFI